VVLANGQILTPRQVASRLNAVRGVAIYRFTQRSFHEVEVDYVRGRFHKETTPEDIRQRCHVLLPQDVHVKVREIRKNILPQKIRPVASEVSEKRMLKLISDIPA